MIIIGDILIPESKRERQKPNVDYFKNLNYYDWLYDIYQAGAGIFNTYKICSNYAQYLLGRPIKETFAENYYIYFGDEALIASGYEFDDIYDILIDIL